MGEPWDAQRIRVLEELLRALVDAGVIRGAWAARVREVLDPASEASQHLGRTDDATNRDAEIAVPRRASASEESSPATSLLTGTRTTLHADAPARVGTNIPRRTREDSDPTKVAPGVGRLVHDEPATRGDGTQAGSDVPDPAKERQ